MSVRYNPVGKEVAQNALDIRRHREYNPHAHALGDLLANTIDRIDAIMAESRSGCSFEVDGQGQHHRYDRLFNTSLYTGGEARQTTLLSFLRIANAVPKKYITERYFVTIEHGDMSGEVFSASSYIFTRFVQSRLAAQVQYSVDLPDWITHPEGGPNTFWNDAVAYDIMQLDAELIMLEKQQHYEDEVAAWDQARGLVPLKLKA